MKRVRSFPIAEDRLWRISAYGLATLIHVPLIMAAHQFAASVSASEPFDNVITLLDAPAIDRTIVAPPVLQRPATVVGTAERGTVAAEPSAASVAARPVPVETQAAPTVIASVRATERAASAPSSQAATVAALAVPSAVAGSEPATADPSIAAASAPKTTTAAAAPQDVRRAATPPTPAPVLRTSGPNVARTTPNAASAATSAIVASIPSVASPLPAQSPDTAQPGRSAATVPAPVRTGNPATAGTAEAARVLPPASSAAPAASATRSEDRAQTAASAAASPVSATSAASASPVPRAMPRIAIPAGTAGRSGSPAGARSAAVGATSTTAATAARPATAIVSVPASAATASAAPVVAPRQTLSPSRTVAGTALQEPFGSETAGSRSALTRFVQGYDGGGCFAALPSGSSTDDVAVSGFSRDEAALGAFNTALGTALGARAAGRRVSDAQCSALAFARGQLRYPDFPVRIALTPDRIASGDTIRGTILGAGDAPVTLLVLDDEGRIQDVTFLLSASDGGSLVFETPLSLTGEPASTVQLFVVLSGNGPTAAMRPPVPVEARRYFQEIARLASESGAALDVAIAAFTVDRRLAEPPP